MAYTPQPTTAELAHRLGASAASCAVVSSVALSPCVREVVLHGGADVLAGRAGNDVMVRVENAEGRFVRRRFSVRSVDHDADTFSLWLTTDHEGPAVTWAREAMPGDHVDVIGPRGKVVLDERADWHLFVGDLSGLAAFYRMAQAIEVPGRAVFVVEIDHPEDALTASFHEGLGVTGIFVERRERSSRPGGSVERARGLRDAARRRPRLRQRRVPRRARGHRRPARPRARRRRDLPQALLALRARQRRPRRTRRRTTTRREGAAGG